MGGVTCIQRIFNGIANNIIIQHFGSLYAPPYDFHVRIRVKPVYTLGGSCTGGSFMGENCMFITLPVKLKKKNILNTYPQHL